MRVCGPYIIQDGEDVEVLEGFVQLGGVAEAVHSGKFDPPGQIGDDSVELAVDKVGTAAEGQEDGDRKDEHIGQSKEVNRLVAGEEPAGQGDTGQRPVEGEPPSQILNTSSGLAR